MILSARCCDSVPEQRLSLTEAESANIVLRKQNARAQCAAPPVTLRSKWSVRDRWMHRAARLRVNQGDGEGVNSGSRPNQSPPICQEIARNAPPLMIFLIKHVDCSRWMQCDARSQVNQGEAEGVDLCPRLKMSPKICQEIAHNAPPQVIFFTKNETTPIL